ncbi:hypothetical protein QG569_01825 [Weissella cibaria]|uniref:hypothetical protein n=1 Tax=Weissella cibaria TaxID=137591 RepID=UPI0025545980|nr:hypothetical protein [Weissella cibaria]MDK9677116.1 hypothetical protein [Weissella cibaria]
MQQWWQRKFVLGAGLIGAIILMLESVIATFVWPTYKLAKYPLAVLTAPDAMYASGFHGLELVAGLLILLTLVAVWRFSRYEQDKTLSAAMQQLVIVWLAAVILQLVWPLNSITEAVLARGVIVRDVVFGGLVIVLIWSLWRVAIASVRREMDSLANGLKLLTILFGLFHVLQFVVPLLGWPLVGFFDVLALDVLAAGFGLMSWYFMRLAD